MRETTHQMLDLVSPRVGVQVQIETTGRTLWVNVDGICRLRIQDIKHLEVDDDRPQSHPEDHA